MKAIYRRHFAIVLEADSLSSFRGRKHDPFRRVTSEPRRLSRLLAACGDWWARFVPVGALLVGVRDLQDPRFIQRFA
jgi:hypothetical protein